jgi:Ca-activated chloride channel family protein
VFIVDASSSMRGRAFEQARAMVERAISGLRANDSVEVIGFSDRVVRMSEAAGNDARERAAAFLADLRATGGTRMVAAIEDGLDRANASAARARGRVPIAVLVTDGYIANENEVLRAIASHLGSSRLYTMGVGSSPNRFLLERAAEVGRGRAVITALGEDPRVASDRFHAFIDRPVFTDIEIDWGGLEVADIYPRRIPDLFADRPLLVHARYVRGGNATVRIRGSVNGTRHERVIDVSLPNAPTPDGPHASQETLWARAAIGDRVRRLELRDDPAIVTEVTELGLAHHIVTPYTSFVAVEEAPDTSDEAEAEMRATVTPARALPGDPEIRIPAPADARAVTVLLPFGETIDARWEPAIQRWTARFLIPRDAEEGTYPIEVLVTLGDGTTEHLTLHYTVDASAPQVELAVLGEVRPGASVTLRARQVITEADLAQVGRTSSSLSAERAQLLADVRRVEARAEGGDPISLAPTGPSTWESVVQLPSDIGESVTLEVFVADLAANVTTQRLVLEVVR